LPLLFFIIRFMNLIEEIEKTVKPVLDEMNFELVEVKFSREGNNRVLRICIDKARPIDENDRITLKDCGNVSERIGFLIDQADLIKDNYTLEVSSPGINRPLKKESDFLRFRNKKISVKLYMPVNGQKNFTGHLRSFENNVLKLEAEPDKIIEFQMKDIASAKLEPDIKLS